MKQNYILSKSTTLCLIALGCLFLFTQCNKDDLQNQEQEYLNLPAVPFDYASLPNSNSVPHPSNDADPPTNPVTNDGATLGRVLFYDTALSQNDAVSCASCHKQEFSFSDNVAKSQGVNGRTIRNSMHLVNIRHLGGGLFWDGRAQTLEIQTLMPIQDHIEMDLTLPEMILKLQSRPYYAALFEKAFGNQQITSDKVSKALSQFIRSLNSYNSKFDRNVPRTPQEQLGYDKFFQLTDNPGDSNNASCTECHQGIQQVSFQDYEMPRIDFPLGVNGRGFEDEPNLMKVANIRNIELTGPYGHDGRYATLDILLQHHGNNVSAQDRVNLIAFLKTLTDRSFITDVRYSNPHR